MVVLFHLKEISMTDRQMTMKEVSGYLQSKGVPRSMIEKIRIALSMDAVRESDNIHMDRIYVGMALMLYRTFGFGVHDIMAGLRGFDNIVGESKSLEDWQTMLNSLYDETGIIIHSDDGERIIVELPDVEEETE